MLALVKGLAEASTSIPSRSGGKVVTLLVLWSSGCKDYGTTKLYSKLELKLYTESTPLDPPAVIRSRIDGVLRALEFADIVDKYGRFDVVIIRASPICGYSGSYYGAALEYTAAFATSKNHNGNKTKVLKFIANVDTIIYRIYVDDCADTYVALARAALFDVSDSLDKRSCNSRPKSRRAAIARQVYIISGWRYETLAEVGAALAAEYGFTGGTQFGVSADQIPKDVNYQSSEFVFRYSLWVSSDKIRALIG